MLIWLYSALCVMCVIVSLLFFRSFKVTGSIKDLIIGIVSAAISVASYTVFCFSLSSTPETIVENGHTYVLDETVPKTIVRNGRTYILADSDKETTLLAKV